MRVDKCRLNAGGPKAVQSPNSAENLLSERDLKGYCRLGAVMITSVSTSHKS